MQGRQQLLQLLREMQQDKQSGQIHYLSQQGNGKIIFSEGVLCSLLYKREPIPASALGTLDVINAVIISTPHAAPLSPSSDTPSIASVFEALENAEANVQHTPEEPQVNVQDRPAVDLVSEVTPLLEELYGERASKLVSKVVEQCPPDHQPQAFLGKCQKLVAFTLGDENTKVLFRPLYKKVQGL